MWLLNLLLLCNNIKKVDFFTASHDIVVKGLWMVIWCSKASVTAIYFSDSSLLIEQVNVAYLRELLFVVLLNLKAITTLTHAF